MDRELVLHALCRSLVHLELLHSSNTGCVQDVLEHIDVFDVNRGHALCEHVRHVRVYGTFFSRKSFSAVETRCTTR